jgi:hypothetical protein
MKINNSDLIKTYRAYIQDQIPQSREKCPSPEDFLNFFIASGSGRKKQKTIDHITNCAYCAHEFSFFFEIYREERRFLEEIDRLLQQKDPMQVSQKKRANSRIFHWSKIFHLRPSWKYALVPLLTIIFVTMMLLLMNRFSATKNNGERGKLPGHIQLTAPTHEHAAHAPLIFRWKGVTNSNYCVLEIFDGALSPLWKSPRIFENFYQLPPDIAPKIEKNRVYFWMITVFSAEGKEIESFLEDFRLIE